MNYKLVLEHLGLVEGVDFTLTQTSFQMKSKIRQVLISPEVRDAEGFIVTEAVYADQEYTPTAPDAATLESTWDYLQLKDADLALVINEYLADKKHLLTGDDELHIGHGQLRYWGFKNIPQPTVAQLVALIPVAQQKLANHNRMQEKIVKGEKATAICDKALNLISGYNQDRLLTDSQITEMTTTFAPIVMALSVHKRPLKALELIHGITPDGAIVTAEMKADLIAILQG